MMSITGLTTRVGSCKAEAKTPKHPWLQMTPFKLGKGLQTPGDTKCLQTLVSFSFAWDKCPSLPPPPQSVPVLGRQLGWMQSSLCLLQIHQNIPLSPPLNTFNWISEVKWQTGNWNDRGKTQPNSLNMGMFLNAPTTAVQLVLPKWWKG